MKNEIQTNLAPLKTWHAKTCEELADVEKELESVVGECSKLQLEIQDLTNNESQDCQGRSQNWIL
jgi:regulator of replication initiation timing